MTESKEKSKKKERNNIISAEAIKKIVANANYCYNCNRCVNVCPLSLVDLFYPRDLIIDFKLFAIRRDFTK